MMMAMRIKVNDNNDGEVRCVCGWGSLITKSKRLGLNELMTMRSKVGKLKM